jgi:DNA invertase Pin-like site-specific DNA recombinase
MKANPAPSPARVLGYARVSRDDQNLDMQLTALRNAGATDLYVEKISAVNAKRPMFNLMMKFVEAGDTIIAYAFNRLYRDLKMLLTFVDDMKALGVTLLSTTEPHINPYTTNGRLLLSVTGAVDENERGRIRDRTRDGMAERKRQGMYLGRRKLFNDKQTAQIKRDRRKMTAAAVAKKWKCSVGTIDKYAPMRRKK